MQEWGVFLKAKGLMNESEVKLYNGYMHVQTFAITSNFIATILICKFPNFYNGFELKTKVIFHLRSVLHGLKV